MERDRFSSLSTFPNVAQLAPPLTSGAYTLRGRCIGYDASASFAIEVIATPQ